ncbi:C40 family peptidase [Streptomyces palmae]|uniref:NlpC/P60 family protein n=1 Tax=Streptomyces palmae TaxID=1701085 RepID=A0A4Z0HFA6_9ACTN|nr:C40 family peptidase [Streptomyces palmae]TGB13407.1 NlpC/P60 family protein [Streptomyces palmae]
MTARTGTATRHTRIGTASLLTAAAIGALLVPALPGEAQAAVPLHALRIAASKRGAPYQYGAIGPRRFDCSGLTLYSFKRAGKRLPRTAAQQYRHTRHISPSARRRGDLVFFHYGGHVYHVGIYAGHGRIWHAPKTGSVVRLERIWSRGVWYGRVR